MSGRYVMLGNNRIDCPQEYLTALGLINGQEIDHAIVNDMNKLANAAHDLNIKAIGNGIDRLIASHAELLAAAKEALDNMNDGRPDFHPSIRCLLQAAIAKAEKLAP